MMTFFSKYIDLKTFFLCLIISVLWILFSDHLVHNRLFEFFDVRVVQTYKGLFYVTCLSLLLGYSHQREKNLLKKQQEDYSRLFTDSPQISWIYRVSDFKIIDVNQKAIDHYGYTRSEFLDLTVVSLRPKNEEKKFLSAFHSGKIGEKFQDVIWTHQKKNGESFPVKVYSRGISFQGEECRLVTIIDVTEFQATEDLSEIQSKLITLGEVSANIAHEVKNPLLIMELSTQKLEESFKKDHVFENYKKDLQILNASIVRVNDTVSSLQRLSRGENDSDKDDVVVSLLLKESSILIRQQLELHAIHLEFGFMPEDKLRCHSGQMTQVILNLLKNALDALIESDVKRKVIRLSAEVIEKTLVIKVQNNGPKLEEGAVSKIFHPYFTTKTKDEGTGLGLSISQKIVRAHNGEIRVDSNDEWTTFSVLIPFS